MEVSITQRYGRKLNLRITRLRSLLGAQLVAVRGGCEDDSVASQPDGDCQVNGQDPGLWAQLAANGVSGVP